MNASQLKTGYDSLGVHHAMHAKVSITNGKNNGGLLSIVEA